MIRFEHLTKSYRVQNERKIVIDDLDLTLPTGKSLALMGRNGAGKSTLMKIISGTLAPDSGRVLSDGSISWPVGLGGTFHGDMTGAQNVRFVARVYGVDSDELVDFVEEFADIGPHFHMPVRTYSSGMKSRLTFGTSMGVPFDTYLVDEITAVGDTSFKRKSQNVFRDRLQRASGIMVSHNTKELLDFCDSAIVLENGHLSYFDDLSEAIRHHEKRMMER